MAWSPGQYVKFEDERTRPARDLLQRVPLDTVGRGFDLGCGPGNSTELLVARFGAAGIAGLDNDANMLAAARQRLPRTTFIEADLATWQPDAPADLLFANAAFQWLPNHLEVFDRLMDGLRPGGVLAVQMPDNVREPSHLLMEETAHDGPWCELFANNPVARAALPSPAVYYDRLIGKAAQIDIWHVVYNHPLQDAAAIVEWVKGSGLRSYLDVVGADRREAFLSAYLKRIAKAYPTRRDGRVLLRFPRLFIVAVRG